MKILKGLKRYLFFIIMLAATGLLLIINRETGLRAINTSLFSIKEMALIIPPIFILLGLLDVWFPEK